MAQSDGRKPDSTAAPNLFGGDLMGFGNKPVEALMGMQKQMLETFEQINKDRAARFQQETELASTFAGKLTSARSIPDVMGAYQEWATKRMEMFSADSKKLFDDTQKVFSAATGLFTNGRGGGPST
jgi:Phasin protein